MMDGALNVPGLAAVVGMARHVSGFPALPVLIVAESGAPAEAVARLVHNGPTGEWNRPWVHLSCEGRPEEAIEADLFGGSDGRDGRALAAVDRARGGTLFIDSIPSLSPEAQTRLLAYLVRAEGENNAMFRIIAATSTDLHAAIRQRHFRSDLFRRLSAITITIPPLRKRPDDIESLAVLFARGHARSLGKPFKGFSADALACLKAHPYPENEEELERAMGHAMVTATDATIEVPSLRFEAPPIRVAEVFVSDAATSFLGEQARPPTLGEIERAYVVWALRHTNSNRTAAARLLGISYPTIARKIAAYRIDVASLSPESL